MMYEILDRIINASRKKLPYECVNFEFQKLTKSIKSVYSRLGLRYQNSELQLKQLANVYTNNSNTFRVFLWQ